MGIRKKCTAKFLLTDCVKIYISSWVQQMSEFIMDPVNIKIYHGFSKHQNLSQAQQCQNLSWVQQKFITGPANIRIYHGSSKNLSWVQQTLEFIMGPGNVKIYHGFNKTSKFIMGPSNIKIDLFLKEYKVIFCSFMKYFRVWGRAPSD